MRSDPRAPAATNAAVRAVMKGNRGQDTAPELKLRSELHRRGLRFRKHTRPLRSLRCLADVVFPSERCAVFVDGCYWHGCPEHGRSPGANKAYWDAKFTRNKERDARNNRVLAEAGWTVIRVWEHQSPGEAADLVETTVRRLRSEAQPS